MVVTKNNRLRRKQLSWQFWILDKNTAVGLNPALDRGGTGAAVQRTREAFAGKRVAVCEVHVVRWWLWRLQTAVP